MMRIAIVNDLRMAVEALRRVVTSVPGYEIAWIAEDGEQAVRLCAADVPDVILMDLIMPRMDGVEATRRIMRDSPCAILVVTATVDGNASKVFEAMGWGALDAVNTPVLGLSGEPAGAAELLAKIAMLRQAARQIAAALGGGGREGSGGRRRLRARTSPWSRSAPRPADPSALARVLGGLPPSLRAAVTIVQHVDEHFAPGLALVAGGPDRARGPRDPAEPIRSPPTYVQLASTNDHLDPRART